MTYNHAKIKQLLEIVQTRDLTKADSRKLMTIGKLNKMALLQKSRFSRSSGGLVLFEMLALLLLLLLLVLADLLCYQQALSVVLDEQAGYATLSVGSETVPLGFI